MRPIECEGADGLRNRVCAVSLALFVCSGLAGCGGPKSVRLTCDLPAPVHLGPALAIGGKPLVLEPSDDVEYWKEVGFRSPPKKKPGKPEVESALPAFMSAEETGRENVSGPSSVRGRIHVGRYAGLIFVVPVGDTYVGYAGSGVRVTRPAEGAAKAKGSASDAEAKAQ